MTTRNEDEDQERDAEEVKMRNWSVMIISHKPLGGISEGMFH